jgi:kinesin family protein 4/21/27
LTIDAPQGRKLFVFDRVFGEDVSQEGIWDYLVESVNAFVQGYNVSMLAYGQSGAGKSYTMGTSGPAEQGDLEVMGVIPRAAMALFEKLEGPKPNNRNSMSGLRTPTRYSSNAASLLAKAAERTWSLKATYVEIYNEQLRDLLVPDHIPHNERGSVTIREDTKGHILLTGLHQVDINSVEDLMAALNTGSMIRQTDSTAVNAKSSRSHAVFSLNLVQRKSKFQGNEKRHSVPLEAMTGADTMVTIDSKLHFVDLAGSERLKNTGAQGERAKEGISINAGLASLGKVISQLSSRQAGAHVSYRDSKLTRLLQDSLGGNAITYMIACVTPAEFHQSETLNTVQYAQRARAIQSKPRIQQTSDETDKQAVIDRLKAEIAFLRDQIRSSSERGNEERGHATAIQGLEGLERPTEKEFELQNRLLDLQENYSALSGRHANLLKEMANARDIEAQDNEARAETLGETATERLDRSNKFAEVVNQVVLEYEKTIQSLEQALSATRSNLSNCEHTLSEKESMIAYSETINTSLQARLQKLMDRENSTEQYLRDLESRLDGHNEGEERSSSDMAKLRKELARVRENEASCEDYISTLEDRLAAADVNSELMQKELDRLEHLVERQRSLGKLDNLLYELDHIQQEGKPAEPEKLKLNGKHSSYDHSRQLSLASRRSHMGGDVILETPEGEEEEYSESDRENLGRSATDGPVDNGESIEADLAVKDANGYPPQSPAQSKFVEDKLETVSTELFELRVEHEATVSEFNFLHSKYEEALRTLAELRDTVDEARHPNPRDSVLSISSPVDTRHASFLADARINELRDGHYSSSRSLSSELSSAGEFSSTTEISDPEATLRKLESGGAPAAIETRDVRRLEEERAAERAEKLAIAEKYAKLAEQHTNTLDLVEELKTEVSKAKMVEATSPRSTTPVIRRKSSQNVMMVDKAHRAFASLRNIASENFEDNPDTMQNFELNLNTAMHELHTRSERVQELEADITAVRKEMETKMQIISGLTRERSSMKASPMDMSVVSSMRDQLMKSENETRLLQETHAAREQELQAELEMLRAQEQAMQGELESSRAREAELRAELELLRAAASANGDQSVAQSAALKELHDKKIADLKAELADQEMKHKTTLESMESSKNRLQATIAELEQQLATISGQENTREVDNGEESGRLVSLQKEIEEHKAAVAATAARVVELEQSHASTREELNEATKARDLAIAELEGHKSELQEHKSLLATLQQQIADHEDVVKTHQDSLTLLNANHTKEIKDIVASTKAEHDAQLVEIDQKYHTHVEALELDLTEARDDLTKVATQVAFALGVDVSTEKLPERIADLLADQKALAGEMKKNTVMEQTVAELSSINDTVVNELQTVKAELAALLLQTATGKQLDEEHATVSSQLAALKKEMSDLETKNKKNSRLVEELEDQLAQNYDQHQISNNRLSTLQTERNLQVEEANAAQARAQSELAAIKEEYTSLQSKFDELQQAFEPGTQRSNSIHNHLRKSPSVASLPSPPPAIPLPPLPGSLNAAVSPQSPTLTTRPGSKEITVNAQVLEDQKHQIRTLQKHLEAEKQLTNTLEEALTDLERQSNKMKADCDAWRHRAAEIESELQAAKEKLQNGGGDKENRWSIQQVEEERQKRREAEAAKAHLEQRMRDFNNKKKKKGSLNCF